jgi:hypothetical protein
MARAVKRSISAGPVADKLPWKYINNAAIRLKPAMLNAKE